MFSRVLNVARPVEKRSFITVINQAELAYREFLGSNRVKLEPGLRINIPILHQIHRIDRKETGIPVDHLNCFTKDNVPVVASGTLFFKVDNAEKACFEVNNYVDSIHAVGSSSTRAVIGRFDYDETIKEREKLNTELQKVIGDSIKNWGVDCTRFEMNVFEPQNHHVAKQMEKQMEAERARRENELNTQANIRTAEGEKSSQIHKADGSFYSAQKIAEAERYKIDQSTEALINRVNQIKKIMPNLSDKEVMTIILEEKRLEHLKELAHNPNGSKTYFVDPSSMFPSVKALLGDLTGQKSNHK